MLYAAANDRAGHTSRKPKQKIDHGTMRDLIEWMVLLTF
jgi:hypothetical protein